MVGKWKRYDVPKASLGRRWGLNAMMHSVFATDAQILDTKAFKVCLYNMRGTDFLQRDAFGTESFHQILV